MRATIGVRMHSGWGVLTAVSTGPGAVEVIDRRRIALTVGISGASQPYHFAENMNISEAEEYLADCFAASERLASAAVREVIDELRGRGFHLTGSAILWSSGLPLPPLSKILASHALIHAAEGEFFRTAFRKACEGSDVSVTSLQERNLDAIARGTFGDESNRLLREISMAGRHIGPPWTKDQKLAALAALILLEMPEA